MNASSGSGLWPTRRTGAAVVVASVMKMASKVGGQCTREKRKGGAGRGDSPRNHPRRGIHMALAGQYLAQRDPHGGLPPEFSPVAVSRTRVMCGHALVSSQAVAPEGDSHLPVARSARGGRVAFKRCHVRKTAILPTKFSGRHT